MTRYIDKYALVAEIEKLITNGKLKCQQSQENNDQESYIAWSEHIATCGKILLFLDTLEVKEVDEEPVSEELEEAIEKSFIYHKNHGDDFRSDKQIETAYMHGFETGTKWANKHLIEVNEVDLNKEIKDYFDKQPIITRSKGVDYRLIPSAEKIAKHFFELGLKAQKGENE